MRVLVTYASPNGSTRGIAERIAARLRATGAEVDCVPVPGAVSPRGYDAVVVGSAVHDQAWLPEAARFLTGHAGDLAAQPVWLFSVGMPGALPRPLRRFAMREGPKVVEPFLAAIRPRGTRLFSGIVRREQFPGVSRVVMRMMGGRFGDFRDWPAIDAWADAIGATLATVDRDVQAAGATERLAAPATGARVQP